MSEKMEEEDRMGLHPTGRAELDNLRAHKNASGQQSTQEATNTGKRGTNWQPWEDRTLFKETLAVDPYLRARNLRKKICESR
jgi:hypothetical protein